MPSSIRGPRVSIVVPVRNGESTLEVCLASLGRLDHPADQLDIVVVDNGSTDRTPEIIRSHPVRVVREDRRGLSVARNRGIAESRGELVAFVDADIFVTTRWLAELLEGLRDERYGAAVGEVVAFPPGTAAERYAAARKPLWQEWVRHRPRPWFLFSSTLVRREVLKAIGPFDTRFLGCAEDIDYAWRFFSAGGRVCYRPKAVAFHRHRSDARALFRQHVGYGRGQAVLRRKYPTQLAWGWREEAGAWWDLGREGAAVAWGTVGALSRQRTPQAEYRMFDLVRKLGQRTGFVRETLRAWARSTGG